MFTKNMAPKRMGNQKNRRGDIIVEGNPPEDIKTSLRRWMLCGGPF
jgi:hypothetical protein